MKLKTNEVGIRELYKRYKEKTTTPVSYSQYKDLLARYTSIILDHILDGDSYRIPLRLGYFRIKKYKTNLDKLAIDYKSTKLVGSPVYYFNNHSDGFRIKFQWEKKRAILKKDAKRPYSFTPAREVKRNRLAIVMKTPNGHTRYPEEIYI